MKLVLKVIVSVLLVGSVVLDMFDVCFCHAIDNAYAATRLDKTFVNPCGTPVTEADYKILEKRVGEDVADTMNENQISIVLKDPTFKVVSRVEKYYIEEQALVDGRYVNTEREASLNEIQGLMDSSELSKKSNVKGKSNEIITSAKKLTMSTSSGALSGYKQTTVICDWLTLPKTKSYDIIGVRLGEYELNHLNIYNESISAQQIWDGNVINYNVKSDNVRIIKKPSVQGVSGVGMSMNIKDSVKKSLRCTLTVVYSNGKEQWTTYGSYQHATKTVSDSDKKKYVFSAGGAGNVFKFDRCIENSYDYMSGVYATNFTN